MTPHTDFALALCAAAAWFGLGHGLIAALREAKVRERAHVHPLPWISWAGGRKEANANLSQPVWRTARLAGTVAC
eukprot:CAMPEP_0206287480 /NCGR_PEP_ID=MMETSP0106_2-20121207/1127_1 /ASSEMBLY_ACC=CAM_ASM_000206 /TAXON_ID=81532 /ORGANISM="Acanthoeca-like sp., Strain 10tr" /LENGTH=74 /DNA_ID=CAMNT_0053718013 /DNA_START=454 /DNA_END=678 /DNA_ORIENTATION=+